MKPIKIKLSNVDYNLPDGAVYTAPIALGSQAYPANVLLDTGSSTFAIYSKEGFYDPGTDKDAVTSDIALTPFFSETQFYFAAAIQTSIEFQGTWQGQPGKQQFNNFYTAAAYYSCGMQWGTGKGQGIMGLAYPGNASFELNTAYKMKENTWENRPKIEKTLTLQQARKIGIEIESGIVTNLETPVEQMMHEGCPGKFAFYTLRSTIREDGGYSTPADDPQNQGWFVLGGGEECADLYTGDFSTVYITQDTHYTVTLIGVDVAASDSKTPISPANKDNAKPSDYAVDTGTSFLGFQPDLVNELKSLLTPYVGVKKTAMLFNNLKPVPASEVAIEEWPDIILYVVGDGNPNGLTPLRMKPQTYWQLNGNMAAPRIIEDGSILGLPLLNNYFTIFEPMVKNTVTEDARGVIKFAKIKQ